MKQVIGVVFALGFLAAAGCGGGSPEARIRALGGTVDKDANDPAAPIVGVRLVKCSAKDDDLKWIATLPALDLLDLTEAPVTPAGLQYLTSALKLEFLHLGKSRITDEHLKVVAGIKGLRQLSLNECDLSGASLEHLAWLPKLMALDLSSSTVTDQQLECLPKLAGLQTLNIMNTPITDKSVPYLLRSTGLSGLQIQRTKISQEGVARLRAGLPKCPGNSIVNN